MNKFGYCFIVAFCCSCTSGRIDGDSGPLNDSDIACATKSSILNDSRGERRYAIDFTAAKTAAEELLSSGEDLVEFFPLVVENDTLLYIANYNKGYKIISSDSRTSVILLESADGKFSFDDPLEIGEFNAALFWLDNLAADIYALKAGLAESVDTSNVSFWNMVSNNLMTRVDSTDFEDDEHVWVRIQEYETHNTYDENTVDHLIQTKWGQMNPWNVMVPYAGSGTDPHCPTGCSAVAVAQMLYFTHNNLGKPTWLYHDAEYTGISYDSNNYYISYFPGTYTQNSSRWNDMAIDRYDFHTDYVSSLMADVGHTLEMEYSPQGSGAFIDVEDLEHYGIECSASAFNMNTVNADLLSGRPVIITAYYGENTFLGIHLSYFGGHAWIIDGMKTRINETVRGYVWWRVSDLGTVPPGQLLYSEEQALAMEPGLYPGKRVTETFRAFSYFYLMNWGWSGAYYDNLLYGAADAIWQANGNDYQYDKSIIHNIH